MCCCGKGGCPQWPDRCCLCFSRKGGVVLTGILTILDNICIILLCTYARINEEFWSEGTWTIPSSFHLITLFFNIISRQIQRPIHHEMSIKLLSVWTEKSNESSVKCLLIHFKAKPREFFSLKFFLN